MKAYKIAYNKVNYNSKYYLEASTVNMFYRVINYSITGLILQMCANTYILTNDVLIRA
jgi:hypothetical protein